jgi:hypothetical protein
VDQHAWFTARGRDPSNMPEVVKAMGSTSDAFAADDTHPAFDCQTAALMHSEDQWARAVIALGGEFESIGTHFHRLPRDLQAQDDEEFHRRSSV